MREYKKIQLLIDNRGGVYTGLLKYINSLPPKNVWREISLVEVNNQQQDIIMMYDGTIVRQFEWKLTDLLDNTTSFQGKARFNNEIFQYFSYLPPIETVCYVREPSKEQYSRSKFQEEFSYNERRHIFRETIKDIMHTFDLPYHYFYNETQKSSMYEKFLQNLFKTYRRNNMVVWKYYSPNGLNMAGVLSATGLTDDLAAYVQKRMKIEKIDDLLDYIYLDYQLVFNEFKESTGRLSITDAKKWYKDNIGKNIPIVNIKKYRGVIK